MCARDSVSMQRLLKNSCENARKFSFVSFFTAHAAKTTEQVSMFRMFFPWRCPRLRAIVAPTIEVLQHLRSYAVKTDGALTRLKIIASQAKQGASGSFMYQMRECGGARVKDSPGCPLEVVCQACSNTLCSLEGRARVMSVTYKFSYVPKSLHAGGTVLVRRTGEHRSDQLDRVRARGRCASTL